MIGRAGVIGGSEVIGGGEVIGGWRGIRLFFMFQDGLPCSMLCAVLVWYLIVCIRCKSSGCMSCYIFL